ncbi:MAG TPA: bifunctional phosphoribosyl-AMP cyclohydrolase/phosphoribosyl-ATP diphosphatase HisIE [Candidatus Baltobacteraceae bacterium]|nr:bifunctional phosphoribosyl-AMP cyclohydrolase/phosphoribosyl-ATP diphosphatase HisIE [Candidatus Baltobacteraceae bacterium]
MKTLDELQWNADGLLPVVIADAHTGRVLTLAYANREALERTIAERSTFLFSRSRNELWHKGATSGNTQRVVSVAYDCDADALLYRVEPGGPACHTGAQSCFDAGLLLEEEAGAASGSFAQAMHHLRATLKQRKSADPETSYTAKLYAGGVDRIGKKIGEEATEVVIAAKNDSREELVWEASDLLFHLLVMLEHQGIELDEIGAHLLKRAK